MELLWRIGIIVLALGALITLIAANVWLFSTSQTSGTYQMQAANQSFILALFNGTTVGDSPEVDTYEEALGLFSPPEAPSAINESYTIHVATNQPRYVVLESYAHELEHLRMADPDIEGSQHEIIEQRNTLLGIPGAFWNWPPETWEILPQL